MARDDKNVDSCHSSHGTPVFVGSWSRVWCSILFSCLVSVPCPALPCSGVGHCLLSGFEVRGFCEVWALWPGFATRLRARGFSERNNSKVRTKDSVSKKAGSVASMELQSIWFLHVAHVRIRCRLASQDGTSSSWRGLMSRKH